MAANLLPIFALLGGALLMSKKKKDEPAGPGPGVPPPRTPSRTPPPRRPPPPRTRPPAPPGPPPPPPHTTPPMQPPGPGPYAPPGPGPTVPMPVPTIPPIDPSACVLDAAIPDSHRTLVVNTLAAIAQGLIPNASVVELANNLESIGYPLAAQCLRNAIGLGTPPGGVVDTGATVPYTIKGNSSDAGPYYLAKTKTGDGNRMYELSAINPGMAPPDWNGYQAGATINIPASWG